MLNHIFKRAHLAKALQKQDLNLLLKAIRAQENLDQPLSLTVDGIASRECSAIEHCIVLQQPELLEKLLHGGATPIAYAADGSPLLSLAITATKTPLALTTTLLQAGYDCNIDDGEALFKSIEHNDDNLVQLLINRLVQYGADLNLHQRNGQSLLALLMMQERALLIGPLVSSGATLPDNLSALDCSDSIKQLALRKAEDLRIQQLLQGNH